MVLLSFGRSTDSSDHTNGALLYINVRMKSFVFVRSLSQSTMNKNILRFRGGRYYDACTKVRRVPAFCFFFFHR